MAQGYTAEELTELEDYAERKDMDGAGEEDTPTELVEAEA